LLILIVFVLWSSPPENSWLINEFEEWLERLRGGPHRCAVIFVDNSGFDIILGVFPITRELLKRGTKVSVVMIHNTGLCCHGNRSIRVDYWIVDWFDVWID